MNAPVQPSAGSPGPVRHPLVEVLKTAVLAEHERLLAAMFHSIEVTEAADGAIRAEVRERLRLGKPSLERGYQHALGRLFAPQVRSAGGSLDRELGRYSLSPSEAMEEQLRLTAIERTAMAQHVEARAAAEERLRAGIAAWDLPIDPSALGPAAAIQAFRHSLEALDIGLKARLSLYGVFDRSVLAGLDSVYGVALELLSTDTDLSQLPAGNSPIPLDAATHRALRAARDTGGSAQKRDRRLANQLLMTLERDASGAIAQRIGLSGQLIEHAGKATAQDPGAQVWLDRLRWPLIKIALADAGVFEQASHPLRLALRDFRAAFTDGTLAEIERRLSRLEISADFVQPLIGRMPLLRPSVVGRFIEQLSEQDRALHDARLAAARRAVAQALDRCTLGVVRPSGLRSFLRAGWGPLLTRRFLQQGHEAESWQRGLRQLETLLAALANPSTRVRDFEPHISRVGAELFAEGLHADRVERLLLGLREAYDELHATQLEVVDVLSRSAVSTISPGDGFIDFEPESVTETASDTRAVSVAALSAAATSAIELLDLELRPV